MSSVVRALRPLGSLVIFVGDVFQTGYRTRGNRDAILNQVVSVYRRSFATVVFASLFVGAILVIQFRLMLGRFEATSLLGGLTTSAVIREVGPLLIAFILSGKIGAYTAAELGTMRVTEQVDAIECLGTDPLQYLVLPRFWAIILASVLLMILGLILSTIGSMGVAQALYGMNWLQYASSMPAFVNSGTILSGLSKCLMYSFLVAAISCYRGFTATGGARGVGRAVTWSAIDINLYIVVVNFTSGIVFDALRAIVVALK